MRGLTKVGLTKVAAMVGDRSSNHSGTHDVADRIREWHDDFPRSGRHYATGRIDSARLGERDPPSK